MITRFDIKSMMGIPLIKGARVLGALMIMDFENPQRFNIKDLEMASVFGRHAALAIRTTRNSTKKHSYISSMKKH